MTTHDDLETRLRASLRERADDVDTTPALYERVQQQASRGAWLRRGLALAGAAAVVAAAFAVVPPLLPEPELDIADTPQDAAPTDGPTDAAPSLEAQLLDAGLAFATDLSSGGSSLQVGDRVVTSPVRIVAMAASPFWNTEDGRVAAGREDGSIIIIDQFADGGDQAEVVLDADANGGGVAFYPASDDALAWIEGTELHVLPVAGQPEGERSLPLQGDVPDDLRIEQWFHGADAMVILASDPDGGVWRIPMDESDPFKTDVAGPASLHPGAEQANDALLLPDTQLATVSPNDGEGLALTIGEEPTPLPGLVHDAESVELSGPAGQMLAMLDPATGSGAVQAVTEDASGGVVVATWESPRISAVVPTLPLDRTDAGTLDLPVPSDDETTELGGSVEVTGGGAAELGLPTDAPVVGTAGKDLLVHTADGSVQTIAVYPAESEATLGRLAVRPGSTIEDGLVAVESSSEGETSVRFVQLRDGGAAPVGEVLVTDGPVSGLVWTEDGGTVIWSDPAGIHAAGVDGAGDVAGQTGEIISEDTRPVLDAVWTELERDGDFVTNASGFLAVGVDGGTGVEFLGLEREGDPVLRVTGSVGGSDRLELDTHADPGAPGGPSVRAAVDGGTATLQWVADGDRSGDLPDPGLLGGGVRVQVSGGQVLAMGDSRQVLVTFDGEVTDLPTAADWDVLD